MLSLTTELEKAIVNFVLAFRAKGLDCVCFCTKENKILEKILFDEPINHEDAPYSTNSSILVKDPESDCVYLVQINSRSRISNPVTAKTLNKVNNSLFNIALDLNISIRPYVLESIGALSTQQLILLTNDNLPLSSSEPNNTHVSKDEFLSYFKLSSQSSSRFSFNVKQYIDTQPFLRTTVSEDNDVLINPKVNRSYHAYWNKLFDAIAYYIAHALER